MALLSEIRADISTSPARGIRAVTPSDSTPLTSLPEGPCRSFMATVAGNVHILDHTLFDIVVPVQAGVPFPCGAAKIFATNTTATGIFALY